eukprot:1762032-Pleurochrysis_carterae.AAC.1
MCACTLFAARARCWLTLSKPNFSPAHHPQGTRVREGRRVCEKGLAGSWRFGAFLAAGLGSGRFGSHTQLDRKSSRCDAAVHMGYFC